jgi:uncharacterized membrane protein
MIKALLALITAALFAGAALYVSLAEHPARMRLDPAAGLAQWKPSYARATPMQAGLALLSLLLGAWAWWKIGDDWLLAGALLIGANVPLTLLVILPVNRRLKGTAIENAGPETRDLLARWGRLHALRTLLGLAAVAAYFAAFARP